MPSAIKRYSCLKVPVLDIIKLWKNTLANVVCDPVSCFSTKKKA